MSIAAETRAALSDRGRQGSNAVENLATLWNIDQDAVQAGRLKYENGGRRAVEI